MCDSGGEGPATSKMTWGEFRSRFADRVMAECPGMLREQALSIADVSEHDWRLEAKPDPEGAADDEMAEWVDDEGDVNDDSSSE